MSECESVIEMTPTQIEIQYYEWLISQIEIRGNKTYFGLFERMHNTEFIWTVPHDDNRVQDAKDLRIEFGYLLSPAQRKKQLLVIDGASTLEVLVALSRRTAFTAGGMAPMWAWILIENLRLDKMPDPLTDGKADKVDAILEDLIWRQYEYNGRGGFFPLSSPQQDQTKVEIWYQMNSYVMEIQEP